MLSQNNKPNGGRKMKKLYEVRILIKDNEIIYGKDYKIYIKAKYVKDAIKGAITHLYNTEDIYDEENLSIDICKVTYIEFEEED